MTEILVLPKGATSVHIPMLCPEGMNCVGALHIVDCHVKEGEFHKCEEHDLYVVAQSEA